MYISPQVAFGSTALEKQFITIGSASIPLSTGCHCCHIERTHAGREHRLCNCCGSHVCVCVWGGGVGGGFGGGWGSVAGKVQCQGK